MNSDGWDPERIEALSSAMLTLQKRWAVPGVSIALVSRQGVQWAAGFGVDGRGGTVTPSSVFQAASLGKPVFGKIVQSVFTRHGVALDAPLSAWLSSDSMPRSLARSTPRSLLSHTAGVYFDAAADRIRVDADSVGRWQYSGSGYVVLQAALERALARRLPALASEFVFKPLDMTRSGFTTPEASEVARGHDRNGRPLETIRWQRPNAGSSLHTTVLDYANFMRYTLHDTRASDASLFEPVVSVDESIGLSWGLGWALEQREGESPTAFHWGSNPGYKSFAMLDPGRGLALVILTNADNGLELIEDAVGILDSKKHRLFEFYMMHPDD